jgi:hypothetical protein
MAARQSVHGSGMATHAEIIKPEVPMVVGRVVGGRPADAAPWWGQKWRFSLRTLLIAMALVAVGLGLAVYAAR